MKKFIRKEIEKQKAYFKRNNYLEKETNVGGRNLKYFILPANIVPDEIKRCLPDFIFRMTGNPKDGYILGISEKVPEKFRPYAILNEYIEFMEKDLSDSKRAVEAEKEVLKYVPEKIKLDYIKWRADFFQKILNGNKKNPELFMFSPNDVYTFEKNKLMLEKMILNF